MISAANAQVFFGRALGASLGIHVLVAFMIPSLFWVASTAPTVETISFIHVARIQIVPVHPRPAPRPVAPRQSVKPIVSNATHVELARSSPHHTASPPPEVSRVDSSAPTVAAEVRAGDGTGTGASAPQTTATPAERTVASTGSKSAGGYMPFGAEQPEPVLDPDVRKQLDGLGVHVTIIVTVGDDGRTKHIAFDPPLDSQLQARIESLLADASWDPAVCGGGVSCEGRATIKL